MVNGLIEGAAIALALSADTFIAGFSYGAGGVKIPRVSMWVINLVCSGVLGTALLAGAFAGRLFSGGAASSWVSFALLMLMGLIKLLDGITKSIIRRHGRIQGLFRFSMFNFRLVLTLYADPEKADADGSKTLSPGEAAALAFSLSLDAVAAGFGSAVESGNIAAVFVMAALMNAAAIPSGVWMGKRLSDRLPFNISWISGAILMTMASARLIWG